MHLRTPENGTINIGRTIAFIRREKKVDDVARTTKSLTISYVSTRICRILNPSTRRRFVKRSITARVQEAKTSVRVTENLHLIWFIVERLVVVCRVDYEHTGLRQ
jgi:hypothetical protein